MRISYNWLKDYLNADISPARLAEILTGLGLEVEGIEEYESMKGGLAGLVVGQVIWKDQHPNADRLSVTKVDIGSGQPLEIVCGAPNVAAGQKVIVATEGTKLYPTSGEPFVIKKSKVRGEPSEGMICAEDEIGMGTSHDGIMILPEDTPIGLPAAQYFNIEKDTLIDIGLTPNRSDAFCHLGVAQDVAAYLMVNEGVQNAVKMPEAPAIQPGNGVQLSVKVESPEACPRYSGVVIKGLQVKESPNWLKQRLQAVDVRPINNVVDVTNYILHELGQPLHAFDLDAIAGNQVVVKYLPEGTKFVTLDGTERSLSAEDLMICNANEGMCIGGVFGGLKSGVTDATTAIFLESAHFSSRTIRRSSMRHGLRTDAASRFEKGTDPNLPLFALQRAVKLLLEVAGGEVASSVTDLYPTPLQPAEVRTRYAVINKLIGNDLPVETVKKILSALHMDIAAEDAEGVTVRVPTNKPDVLREADVVEEILRIYDYNKVTFGSTIRSAMAFSPKPDPYKMRNQAADFLAAQGFREMMALSLTQSKYFREVLPIPEEELVFINNTANQHLDVMRPSMLMGGLEAVVHNQNRQNGDLRLFEFGKSYKQLESEEWKVQSEEWKSANARFKYIENNHLTIFLTGAKYSESWLNTDKGLVTFFGLKAVVQNLFARFGVGGFQQVPTTAEHPVFGYGLEYRRGQKVLAGFGQVKRSILKKMDIKNPVFYAEINWDAMLDALKKHEIKFTELSKYPTVRRDLALVVDTALPFANLEAAARKAGKELLKEVNLFDVYENEAQLGAGKKSYALSFVFSDDSKTLKDTDIEASMSNLIAAFDKQFGAIIRS